MAMFSDGDAEFDTEVQERVPYLVANAVRLTIAAGKITRMTDALTDWDASYALASSDATDSGANVDQKNLDRIELEESIRDIIDNIPEDLFTTTDRHVLNHPLRDAEPTPVEEKNYAPRLALEESHHLVSTFRITDPQNPDTKAMPNGQKVLLVWYTGERGVINEQALQFRDVELVTRFLKDLNFEADDVSKWAYVKVCYVNTRGKKGPWSELLPVLIN